MQEPAPPQPERAARRPGTPLRVYLRRVIWLSLLPLSVLALFLAYSSLRGVHEAEQRSADALAANLQAALDGLLQERMQALMVLADSPLLTDPADRPRFHQAAVAFERRFGSPVLLAEPGPRLVMHSALPLGAPVPGPEPGAAALSAMSTVFATGRPAVGDRVLARLSKSYMVGVVVPVGQGPQPPQQVLVTRLTVARLQALLDQVPLPAPWTAQLRDGRGVLLASRGLAEGADAATPPLAASAAAAVSASAAPANAVQALGDARRVLRFDHAGWTLMLDRPVESRWAPLRNAAGALGAAILAATLAGALAGSVASRRLLRALARLGDPSGVAAAAAPVGRLQIAEFQAVDERLAAAAQQQAAADQALRESEATFRAIFNGMPDAALFTDSARRVLRVNPAFEAQFGATQAEVAGRSTRLLYPDDSSFERMGQALHSLADFGATARIQQRLRRLDGSTFDAESTASRVLAADGRVLGLFSVHRDITEREAARQLLLDHQQVLEREVSERTASLAAANLDLRASAAFNRAITDHIPGRVSYWDAGLVCRFANPAYLAWIGLPAEQVLGQPAWAVQGQAVFDSTRAHAEAALAGQTRLFQQRSCRGDQVFEHQVIYVPELSDTGELRGILVMAFDITEIMRAKAELEDAHAALAARAEAITTLYDQAPCGYFTLDAALVVTQINQTALRLLGYPSHEVVGREIVQFVAPSSQAVHAERVAAFMRHGRARDLAYDFLHRDGSSVAVLVSGDLVRDAAGAFASVRATMVDNRARKAHDREIAEMQRELARRAELAEAATRAKSVFLANMSHEIRTPMNAIIGLTHLMRRDSRDAQQLDRLGKVDGAARHLLQVINDILDLSKIEAGKTELDCSEFQVDELLTRALAMVAVPAQGKGLELVLDAPALPERLCGDPMRLSQLLINLLSNAVKFTPQGWVRLRGRVLARPGQRVNLMFEVQDTGPGIALARQPGLFAPFEQLDASTTRRYGGTGLGLALTRHLARLMGGDAGLQSGPGEGSCFWVSVWLDKAGAREPGPDSGPDVAAPAPAPWAGADALRGLRVLLVDDLTASRDALAAALQYLGLLVDAEASGEQAVAQSALQMAAGRPYDLMLVDRQMPGLDGPATIRALQRQLGAGMPPCVLLTLVQDAASGQRAELGLADAVLVKPAGVGVLREVLLRALWPAGSTSPPPPVQAGQAELTLQARHAGQRVLLAEDNPVNREVAMALLTSVGLVVEAAPNGRRAVEMALADPPDLVLMDMQMPVEDGLSAAVRLRQALGNGLPIIAMTANAFAEDRAACLAAGMNDHVAKPVDAEHLFATLLRWLPEVGAAG